MLSRPNVVFLVKRGTFKPSSASHAPRTRSHIQVPWTVTSTCGKGSTWWGRCKEPMGWVSCTTALRGHSKTFSYSKLNQGRSHACWLHLISLSRTGSAFCSTGLNDIYGINSWVRGWVDGGGDNNYSTRLFLLFVPPKASVGPQQGASQCIQHLRDELGHQSSFPVITKEYGTSRYLVLEATVAGL